MNVLEVIQKSTEFLDRKKVESPRLQVELMLSHLLKLPRVQLYMNFETPVDTAHLDVVRDWVRRRALREPLQRILRTTSFCGFEMNLSPDVLIPRPETELVCEKAWEVMKEKGGSERSLAVLDIGTGSGCLAISVQKKFPLAKVTAVDISAAALKTAELNARALSVQVHFQESDLFEKIDPDSRFDLILSNPPYIPSGEIESLEPEVKDWEPRRALDGGPDGLEFYRQLAFKALPFLTDEGRMILELGFDQAEAVSTLLMDHHWTIDEVRKDYSGIPRILTARRR